VGLALKEWIVMRYLSQRTPLVADGLVYAVTARGELVCVRASTGMVLWRKDYAADFAGHRGNFGWCDQLLIDGKQLIAVPGGPTATVIALDRRTGATIWKCPLGDRAQYVGAVLARAPAPKHYIAVLSGGLAGISPDGRLLWRYEGQIVRSVNSCTPNVMGNRVFTAANYGRGIVLLELKQKGKEVEVLEVYRRTLLTPAWHEMVVCLGDHAYVGTTRGVCCLELSTGKVVWQEEKKDGGLGGQVSGTCADGHLYLFSQRGAVALVAASPKGFRLAGQFALPDAKSKPGATAPVVTGGRLYLRDDDRLFAYEVRKGTSLAKVITHTVPRAPAADVPKQPGTDREPDAIFVPTPQDVVAKMLDLAGIKKTDTVVDLGCGDGRIVVTAARKYGCQAIGYDIDPDCVKMALANVRRQKVEKLVRIERQDLFKVELDKVDVVALYLPAPLLTKLLPQLGKLRAGARVVSHAFAIPGMKPTRAVQVKSEETGIEHTVYLYVAPLTRQTKP
jgi:outer membrane protein assembly factor BamB/precorrin-6B methylase 2